MALHYLTLSKGLSRLIPKLTLICSLWFRAKTTWTWQGPIGNPPRTAHTRVASTGPSQHAWCIRAAAFHPLAPLLPLLHKHYPMLPHPVLPWEALPSTLLLGDRPLKPFRAQIPEVQLRIKQHGPNTTNVGKKRQSRIHRLGAEGQVRWEMPGPGCDLRPSQGEKQPMRLFSHVGCCVPKHC